jgi:NAD(P)-dependent dehydrogenase (short-subunit alcohol dehydrogenase family)
MSRLDGRVVIVTGAGRGLGREHAKRLAAEGAAVVVNDLGADVSGEGVDLTPAQVTAKEIEAAGGQAIVSGHDVSHWEQAGEMVQLAIDTFGTLHTVVNNAGILRDRTIVNMTEEEWDAVIRVHLKGHMAPTRHAMRYWRDNARAGSPIDRPSLVHTSSASGFVGSFGQANYGAAKMGIVGLMQIARMEGTSYGLRSNAIGPAATTRMTEDLVPKDGEPAEKTFLDPAGVSPLVAWLADPACPANGQLFHAYGNRIMVLAHAHIEADLRTRGQWALEDLDRELAPRLIEPPNVAAFLPVEGEQLD